MTETFVRFVLRTLYRLDRLVGRMFPSYWKTPSENDLNQWR